MSGWATSSTVETLSESAPRSMPCAATTLDGRILALDQAVQLEGEVMLPPRQGAKLSRCGCDPSWFCSPHDACFIHKSCLCEGSSKWPPVKPVRSTWVSESCEWLAAILSRQSSPPSSS
jgi:hypothetical protein